MTTATTNILQALLAPQQDIRIQAETAWSQMTVTVRIQEALQVIISSNDKDTTIAHLAAVLLRRDAWLLNPKDQQHKEFLRNGLQQLLQVFVMNNSSAVGDCITEYVYMLGFASGANDAMPLVLNATAQWVSKSCLLLWAV